MDTTKSTAASKSVKDIFTDITAICEAPKTAAQQGEREPILVSSMAISDGVSKYSNQLNCTFMYTQILKDILLNIQFEEKHIKEFIAYCCEQSVDPKEKLIDVKELEKNYHSKTAIWWYCCKTSLYTLLNKALRLMNVDVIIMMAFFMADLHRQIKQLHLKWCNGPQSDKSLTVYRGQGMTRADFEQMKENKGGLISFNNFLSTSMVPDVSSCYAKSNQSNPDTDLVAIHFVMKIDPSKSSTPFALTNGFSPFKAEEEILFSMHTVFRIGDIELIDDNNHPLYQVHLTLTSEDDNFLRLLTKCVREEIEGSTGWGQLGELLLKMGQAKKAEQVYEILLKEATTEIEKARIYHQLGWAKKDQGKYKEALTVYEKSLEIKLKTFFPNHSSLASSYNNIGIVHRKMGEYSKALSCLEKALKIKQQTFLPNSPNLAGTYNNIGMVYENMGEYSKALSSNEKALVIRKESLPPNHPDLAGSYNNIGVVYDRMGEYSKALSSYKEALEIWKKSLPPNHPDVEMCYSNIGLVYENMSEYSEALSFYERAVNIGRQSLPSNHSELQRWRQDLDRV